MRTLTCHCCGADITAPQFHNGNAYGWTCILKVVPNKKRVKDDGLWLPCEISYYLNDRNQMMVRAAVDGVGFADHSHRWDIVDSNRDRNNETRDVWIAMMAEDYRSTGFVRVSKTKDGKNPIWRHKKALELIETIINNTGK